MGLDDVLTLDNYNEIIDDIIESRHFTKKNDSIKPLFREMTLIVISELKDKIPKIHLSYNESYIGFYRVESNRAPRLFITVRTRKSIKEETPYLHVSLKVDKKELIKSYDLKLSEKVNRRIEGDFDFKNLENLKDRLGAIKYSYISCIKNKI